VRVTRRVNERLENQPLYAAAVYLTEYPRASMQAENPRLKVLICWLYVALA
jgi:hypothetical protein